MSYILEAIKKAEAERQSGTTPNVHAQPAYVPIERGAASWWRTPVFWVAPLLLMLLLALVWRQPWQAKVTVVNPVNSPSPSVAVSAAPSLPTAPAQANPITTPVNPGPGPAVASSAPSVAAPAQGTGEPRSGGSRVAGGAPAIPVQTAASPEAPPSVKPEPAIAAEAEIPIPLLTELPESIRNGIPPLTINGYIYSKNPADRVLLIEKRLCHEGEELAPGLILEKLLPRAAVLNYKGARYRIAY